MSRTSHLERTTKETSIILDLNLDEAWQPDIKLGLPFFEHILGSMAFHGGFGLNIKGSGDLDVDPHHLVEDVGLVFGQALLSAFSDIPVARFGHAVIPMDDALSEVTLDFCRRPFLVYRANFTQDRSGNFDMTLLREFFQALANKAEANLHLECRYGQNAHHMSESLFKALGKAVFQASRIAQNGVQSTKGTL